MGQALQDLTPEGIRDLGGNVSEWVADRFVVRYPACAAPCLNPVVHEAEGRDLRVFRGGNYAELASELRGATRGHDPPDMARGTVGFRCARSDTQTSAPSNSAP